MNNLSLNNSIFLVNPIAGKLSLNNKIKTIKNITEGTGAEILVSKSIENAIHIAKESMRKKKIVVACGGDGLQNLVAQQSIENNGIMAILPFGRGNDFASSLSINSVNDLIQSFSFPKLINARYVKIMFNNHYRISLTCAGVGLLSEAAYRAEKIPILKGMLLYSVAAILSFIFLKNHKYIVEFDEMTIEEELLILAGAASQYTGGGMHIAPDALKVKEMVNLLYSRKVNRFQAFNLLLGVFSGSHLKHSKVINIHTARLLVSTQSDSPWAPLVYGDGEYLGDLPVEISLGKKPLRVLVPK